MYAMDLVVYCTNCNCRMELHNTDEAAWFEYINGINNIYYCSSDCRIEHDRKEEGVECDFDN